MKGGIYYPDIVKIGGNEKYGGIDICDILDAIHEKGCYFNDESVNKSSPSLYSKVFSYSYAGTYDSRPGIGTEFASDTFLGLDPLWNYNVFAVYQFAIMYSASPLDIVDFGANVPAFVLQAKASFTPASKSVSRTGYAGQRNLAGMAMVGGNTHMPYTLSDSFAWDVDVLRDGGINVYMDMSFVDPPADTTVLDVSYQARFLVVASDKP